jgi:hypothetical protein
MRTNHVDKLIEAYLHNQLSPELRRQVEQHLETCPDCVHKLAQTERLHHELGPTMQSALGYPGLPPYLHASVKNALDQPQTGWFSFGWGVTSQLLNAAGTISVVVLLAFGAYLVIQSQMPRPVYTTQTTLSSNQSGGSETPSPTATPAAEVSATVEANRQTAGDTLPHQSPVVGVRALPTAVLNLNPQQSALVAPSVDPALPVDALPGGAIAFALFDGVKYQTHLISPDGTVHKRLPLTGVSEPALHPSQANTPLAVRSWNDPDGPRTLVTSDIQAEAPTSITHFWEDAQPDWSPTENRLIFASQRESDRRWRLYSVWGDASLEVNLRREGKAPTFAPDGLRFAFESCDETGKRCGLWVADLENSEFGAAPLLENPQAKSPDWSPVGDQIVYMANPNNNWDIYLLEGNGKRVRRLTDDPAKDGLPVWSPDGKWIAFVSDRGQAWGIWLLHVASGHMQQLVTFDGGSLTPEQRLPYNQHGERFWWDEQISWGHNPLVN